MGKKEERRNSWEHVFPFIPKDPDTVNLFFLSIYLGRSGAGQDGGAPNDPGAAFSGGRVARDASRVLVALLRLLRVEVAVLPRAAWGRRWLLQLSPCFALNPGQSWFS